MKKLIAVRHGNYDMPPYTGYVREEWERAKSLAPLNAEGRRQSEVLAKRLQMVVQNDETVSVLTSSHTRAVETATIISQALGVTPEVEGWFRSQVYEGGELLMHLILETVADADVIIAVMHHEAISGILHAFRMKYFSRGVEKQEFDHCCGMMLNMVSGAVTPFPR